MIGVILELKLTTLTHDIDLELKRKKVTTNSDSQIDNRVEDQISDHVSTLPILNFFICLRIFFNKIFARVFYGYIIKLKIYFGVISRFSFVETITI